jgi:phage terminase large subunit-like protein
MGEFQLGPSPVMDEDAPSSASGRRVDHVGDAIAYAEDVVAGDVPACKWVKAACQRQLDDLARWAGEPDYPFDWRPDLADRVIRYIELLPHVKGRWGGQLIRLEPWQKFGLACVFGWVRKADGARRFRTVYEEVPRKNAKTTKLAGIGLYLLTADEEWGAEVYSAATTRDQAKIVFEIAQQMARADGHFRSRFGVKPFTHSLVVAETASKFLPLSAEGSTLDGLNVSAALIDELHAHKTRAVHDVLDSATGSRAQPLIWKITTAGSNRAGVCYDQRLYLTKILNAVLKRHGGMGYKVVGNAVDDDAFWGIIYTVDDGDDEFDEATWRKANPNYGVSVDTSDLQRMATVAKAQAAALAEFKTKRLNIWVNAESSWMNMLQWDGCADPALREEQFHGKPCIVALDAAFKKDLFAKIRLFQDGDRYAVLGRYYVPEAMLQRPGMEQLAGWVHDGWIRATPGEVLDIAVVRDELVGSADGSVKGDLQRFELAEVAYDPAQITQFATEMLEQNVPMVEMRPLVLHFSPAMKELEELVAGRRLVHAGDPVLGWMVANVVCHRDAKDNIYPRKERADDKIDGAVALIMALARALAPQEGDPDYQMLVM